MTFDSLVRAAVHRCDFHHEAITTAVRDIPEMPWEDYVGVVAAVVDAKVAMFKARIAANEAQIAASKAQIASLYARSAIEAIQNDSRARADDAFEQLLTTPSSHTTTH